MYISKKSALPEKLHNMEGEILQEILGLQAGEVKSHSLASVTIPPGNASKCHFHKKSEESYYILSGKASLEINDKSYQLQAGEAVLIEPNDLHQISNHGDENLVFLAICVPAWHPDDSFDADHLKKS